VTPFIDPVTREKLKFNEDMKQYVPPEQLWSADWGGNMDFEYDHETYWPALNDMCAQRRSEKLARWLAGGKVVGESEEYLAGGTDVSVNGVKYEAAKDTANGAAEDVAEVAEKLAEVQIEEGAKEEVKPAGEDKKAEET
jgi:hypothetical protein